MYEKLTKYQNFTRYLPEKYFPDFFFFGGGGCPLPPSPTPMLIEAGDVAQTVLLTYPFHLASHRQQEQQRVAVGPGNEHLISIRQVSSDAHSHAAARYVRAVHCCMSTATAMLLLLCIDNLMIKK